MPGRAQVVRPGKSRHTYLLPPYLPRECYDIHQDEQTLQKLSIAKFVDYRAAVAACVRFNTGGPLPPSLIRGAVAAYFLLHAEQQNATDVLVHRLLDTGGFHFCVDHCLLQPGESQCRVCRRPGSPMVEESETEMDTRLTAGAHEGANEQWPPIWIGKRYFESISSGDNGTSVRVLVLGESTWGYSDAERRRAFYYNVVIPYEHINGIYSDNYRNRLCEVFRGPRRRSPEDILTFWHSVAFANTVHLPLHGPGVGQPDWTQRLPITRWLH